MLPTEPVCLMPLRRNLDESRSSKRSAFSLVTLVIELTVKGGLPEPTVRERADDPAAVLVLVTAGLLPASGALSEVDVVAVLACPRMKLPPVAAYPTPPRAMNSARSATAID